MSKIIEHCNEWCFTDGHAKSNKFTEFYNDEEMLDEVDWNLVSEKYWNNTEEDFDRMRRKQAEFLVKHHVPVQCIRGVVTFNEQSRNFIQEIVERLGLEIPVRINPKNKYYY